MPLIIPGFLLICGQPPPADVARNLRFLSAWIINPYRCWTTMQSNQRRGSGNTGDSIVEKDSSIHAVLAHRDNRKPIKVHVFT